METRTHAEHNTSELHAEMYPKENFVIIYPRDEKKYVKLAD